MARRRQRDINLPAPYLKRLWLDRARISDREAYPFCLPFLGDDFDLSFERAITIIVGENGTGKSTLLEGRQRLRVEQTDHYKAMLEFFDDPRGLVEAVIGE